MGSVDPEAVVVLADVGYGELTQEYVNLPESLIRMEQGVVTGGARAENNLGIAVQLPGPTSPDDHRATIAAQLGVAKNLFGSLTHKEQYASGVEVAFGGDVFLIVPVESLRGEEGHPDHHRESVKLMGPTQLGGISVTGDVSFQKHAVAARKAFEGFECPQTERVAEQIWAQIQKQLGKGPSLDYAFLQDPKKPWKDTDHGVTFEQLGFTGNHSFVEHIQFLFWWRDPETNEPMTALTVSVISAMAGSTEDPNEFTNLEVCIVSGQVNSWKRNQPIS